MVRDGATPPRRRPVDWLVPLLIACVTFLAFLPALRNGFVTWDDDLNFLDNHRYRGLGWEQLEWMWTTFHLGHYVPVSWMSLGLDYLLWGMNPAGYHFTNLLLHAVNAVLLYHLARRMLAYRPAFAEQRDGRLLTIAAAFAALLFAVHPLRVESVAWVTERRDMLSLLFFFLAVYCYLRAVEGAAPKRWLGVAVATYLFALLSKATTMTLPAVLLVINVYPLRRLGGPKDWWSPSSRRVYLEILPFALLSVAVAAMSIVALRPPDQLQPSEKVAASLYGLAFYLWKIVWPAALSPLYELPTRIEPSSPPFLASYAIVVGVSAFAVAIRRRLPDVTLAWVVFVILLLPMLGLVTNGPQIAADRYTYHAAPVVAMLAAALLGLLARHHRRLALGLGTATVAVLSLLTWRQTHVWRDSHALWSHVLRLDPESSMGHAGMAALLLRQDRVTEAVAHYEKSVASNPRFEEGHNNLGIAYARQGRARDAVAQFERALAIRPGYAQAHSNLGMTLASLGQLDAALAHYEAAVAIDPGLADAHTNWANALVRLGRPADAIPHYEAAVRARPDHADAELNWGVALVQQGQLGAAIQRFERALSIRPDYPEAREYLHRARQLHSANSSAARP